MTINNIKQISSMNFQNYGNKTPKAGMNIDKETYNSPGYYRPSLDNEPIFESQEAALTKYNKPEDVLKARLKRK